MVYVSQVALDAQIFHRATYKGNKYTHKYICIILYGCACINQQQCNKYSEHLSCDLGLKKSNDKAGFYLKRSTTCTYMYITVVIW